MNISSLTGIGPKTQAKLKRLGITTTSSLLYHLPFRYLDFSNKSVISHLQLNQTVTVSGKILSFQNIRTKTGKTMQKIILEDSTGRLLIYFFNQPYLEKSFSQIKSVSFAGTVTQFNQKICLVSPEWGEYNTGKIIPVYPETAGLTSKYLRKLLACNLQTMQAEIDELPHSLRQYFSLDAKYDSLKTLHFPDNLKQIQQSQNTLALYEILNLQLLAQKILHQESQQSSVKLEITPKIDQKINQFIQKIPFTLTKSQTLAWKEILQDLQSPKATNRLLQGDVGSGKTILAILSAYFCYLNNRSAVILAPTEILSRQHFKTFQTFLGEKFPLKLITGKSSQKLTSQPEIVIATHAIFFQNQANFSPGLVIFDEQHKFGVSQRSFFSNHFNPHILTLTATPIPRSIGLTLLGHLKITRITSPPAGRLPIKTYIVPTSKQPDCFNWLIKNILTKKQQIYIVCPFIESSESQTSVHDATTTYQQLSQSYFKNIPSALLHGRLNAQEKLKIMEDFQSQKTKILFTTPLIEVGIDIKPATVIIILSPERFGLAQLHQLRGRVGRGDLQSYCFLFSNPENHTVSQRLTYFTRHKNGLLLAKHDLKSRGVGQIFGLVQHGFPNLKLATITDLSLISKSQKIVDYIMQNYPEIIQKLPLPSPQNHVALN